MARRKNKRADKLKSNLDSMEDFNLVKSSGEFDLNINNCKNTGGINSYGLEMFKEQIPVVRSLKKYQIIGHKMIDAFGGRALVSDEMGMGKSAMCITWVDIKDLYPCVIVCQASMKSQFREEIKIWRSVGNIEVLEGTKSSCIQHIKKLFLIINYDILRSWKEEITRLEPKCIIFDESHTLGNPDSLKARAAYHVCYGVPNILFLSGTPFKNRETELFLALNILRPKRFPSHDALVKDVENGEFHDKLKKYCLIRRLKENHLHGLAKKIRTVECVDIVNSEDYKFAEYNFVEWLSMQDLKDQKIKIHAFSKLEKLKQLAIEGKMPFVIDYIKSYVEDEMKLIVFFAHSKPLLKIADMFKNISVLINGSTTMAKREKAIKDFMTNPQKLLFLGNIKSAGTGITLVSADSVLMAEMPWTSVDCDQCEDRAHRIGQKSKYVSAHYIIGKSTVEERIAQIIDRKRIMIKEAIDGDMPKKNEILMELLDSYINDGNGKYKRVKKEKKIKINIKNEVESRWISLGRPDVSPKKICPECHTVNDLKTIKCLFCGWSS